MSIESKNKAIEYAQKKLFHKDSFLTFHERKYIVKSIEIASKVPDLSDIANEILELAHSNHNCEYGAKPNLEAFYNGKIAILKELESKGYITLKKIK